MSAFLCSDLTFDRIVSALKFYADYTHHNNWQAHRAAAACFDPSIERDEDRENDLAQRLRNLNLDALNSRYGDNPEDGEEYAYSPRLPILPPIHVYKILGCLLYQCSEGKVPEKSLFKKVEAVHNALAHDIVTNSKEYDTAQVWG